MRGELIGQGTYGKVYLALNASTGEMMAVKQVDIPRSASAKTDSRQIAVVDALKFESETLKDLEHPHVVQYLGFEETPHNLSMYVMTSTCCESFSSHYSQLPGVCAWWLHWQLPGQAWQV